MALVRPGDAGAPAPERMRGSGHATSVGNIKMIYAFVAPENCPQINATTPPSPMPRLDQLDHEIIKEFRRHGLYGAPIWKPLNALAKSAGPEDRDELRRIKLELWRRLRGLLRVGVLHSFDRKYVTATKVFILKL